MAADVRTVPGQATAPAEWTGLLELVAFLNVVGVVFTPYAWFGHVLLGIGIQLAVGLPLALARVQAAWWIGAAVSAGFWWGREKMEHEFALKVAAGLRSVGPFWWRGWLPVEWGGTSAWEFLAPTLAGLLIAAAIGWWRQRGQPTQAID